MSTWIQHWRLERLLNSDDSTREDIAAAIRAIAGLESYLLRLGRYTRRPFGRPYRGIEDILLGWGLRRVARCVGIFRRRNGIDLETHSTSTTVAATGLQTATAGRTQAKAPRRARVPEEPESGTGRGDKPAWPVSPFAPQRG